VSELDRRLHHPAGSQRLRVIRAVLFDVDFTLARPGPELGPEGYRRLGERHGLALDPSRYEDARARAFEDLQRHPDLQHDDEIWIAFTERIIRGMGGDAETAHDCAVEMTVAWERHDNFELYEDTLPVLTELRAYGLGLGLVSNTGRDLAEFVAHHRLDVDVAIASRAHGKAKPDPSIFAAALARLEVEPAAAAMVGDSLQDDVEGARALGMLAFLVDRDGRHPEWEGRLPSLYALPAALGLVRPGTEAPG
jgi:putative hydrolase of the HAD superfamily